MLHLVHSSSLNRTDFFLVLSPLLGSGFDIALLDGSWGGLGLAGWLGISANERESTLVDLGVAGSGACTG